MGLLELFLYELRKTVASKALLAIIILFVVFAAILAVYAPTKRIRNMEITETINDL